MSGAKITKPLLRERRNVTRQCDEDIILIGYNSNDSKIHVFSVDNFGTTHDHIGTWKSREHFYMETSEIMKNKNDQ